MKILVRKSDTVVLYAMPELELSTTSATAAYWCDHAHTSANSIIHDAELPELWVGGAYTYINGVWSVVDDSLLDPLRQARAAEQRAVAKTARQALVDNIQVTVAGKTFDGDEVAQTRMSRAIIGMQALGVPTFPWTLADNSIVPVTLAELIEALCLAGQAQSAVWAI
jgi:hypothetical protein